LAADVWIDLGVARDLDVFFFRERFGCAHARNLFAGSGRVMGTRARKAHGRSASRRGRARG
jgi:hypothetical protein